MRLSLVFTSCGPRALAFTSDHPRSVGSSSAGAIHAHLESPLNCAVVLHLSSPRVGDRNLPDDRGRRRASVALAVRPARGHRGDGFVVHSLSQAGEPADAVTAVVARRPLFTL